MRTHQLLSLLFFALLLTGNACKKEDPLPAVTGEGGNIFGCYVAGKAWRPYHSDLKANTLAASYYKDTLRIEASRSTADRREEIFLVLADVPLSVGTYSLDNAAHYGQYATIPAGTVSGPTYTTDQEHTGTFAITKVDKTRRIITGTFSFNAKAVGGPETVSITDGRFDITYF